MPSAASAVVIVFTRAPVAGVAKTRLIPRLGAEGAARLQRRLIRAALRTARAVGPVELHVTRPHSWLRGLRVPQRRQRGSDLGERMYRALKHRRAILIGADAPELRPADLHRALRYLQGGTDVVLAPAEDGGYALIAARRIDARIFDGVRWGGADVLAQTLLKISKVGLRYRLLRTVWDVDRPEDLERIRWLRCSSAWPRGARR
jgi:rSAM/selenodomain-associated transferase 1